MYELVDIVEGKTRIIVPKDTLENDTPPRYPAFYNPAARVNRDISVLAYDAYTGYTREHTFADALAGVGARALRTANEVEKIDEVYINDSNPFAISLAEKSSLLNNINAKCRFSIDDACRFLMMHSSRGSRFGIIDIDPFGTPALYVDCALRAVIDGGMISLTATDTPALNGLYPNVALRRYYGRSIRCEYSNEIGLRLILGMVALQASRLESGIKPLFVQSTKHYMRIYVQVNVGSRYADTMPSMLGYAYHCRLCSSRYVASMEECLKLCPRCSKSMERAGLLWIKSMMDSEFVKQMYDNTYKRSEYMDKHSLTILDIARDEADIPLYYTIDEVSRILKSRPLGIREIVELLRSNGFSASRTSLAFRGFRTDASIDDIIGLVRRYLQHSLI